MGRFVKVLPELSPLNGWDNDLNVSTILPAEKKLLQKEG